MHEEHPDAELVNRAKAGDASAFASLCERHRNRVWRIVASVARGPDVEDLAQEAVVRAYRSFHTYTGEASFAAWLCRIALNAAHDHQKSAWRRRVTLFERHPEEHQPAPESLEGAVERRELQRRVRQVPAWRDQPPRHWRRGQTPKSSKTCVEQQRCGSLDSVRSGRPLAGREPLLCSSLQNGERRAPQATAACAFNGAESELHLQAHADEHA